MEVPRYLGLVDPGPAPVSEGIIVDPAAAERDETHIGGLCASGSDPFAPGNSIQPSVSPRIDGRTSKRNQLRGLYSWFASGGFPVSSFSDQLLVVFRSCRGKAFDRRLVDAAAAVHCSGDRSYVGSVLDERDTLTLFGPRRLPFQFIQ